MTTIAQGAIVGSRTTYEATFVLANNTLEQTILTSTPADYGGSGLLQVEIDATALTNNNTRLRVYHDFGGVFVPFDPIVISAAQQAVLFPLQGCVGPFRVTLQSQVAEGAARNIPYKFSVF